MMIGTETPSPADVALNLPLETIKVD